jgi:hypothetical protein
MMKMKKAVLSVCCAVALAGCAGGPGAIQRMNAQAEADQKDPFALVVGECQTQSCNACLGSRNEAACAACRQSCAPNYAAIQRRICENRWVPPGVSRAQDLAQSIDPGLPGAQGAGGVPAAGQAESYGVPCN